MGDLTSEDETMAVDDGEALAELKKESGNQLYKVKAYLEALPFYSEAIALRPDSSAYYGNRSACYLMLSRYKEALADARKAVELDPTFLKGFVRMAKCSLEMGDVVGAETALAAARPLDPAAVAALPETRTIDAVRRYEADADKAYAKEDYRKVVYCMDRLLELVASRQYKTRRAECLALLGRYQEAQEAANDVLHADGQNADAIFVRGMCLYYQDNLEKAFQHFQRVLRLSPDHDKAKDVYKKAKLLKQKKEEGNEAFKAGRLSAACDLYTEALQVDRFNKPTNAKLFFNRATVLSKLGRTQDAIADCTTALELDGSYLKALLRRGKCHMEMSEYDKAVKDYESACRVDKCSENKRLLQEAKNALKKSKRKDYYKILGIDRNASTDEVKKAYRKRALVHHPDRHASASESEKKEQERRFKEVGEAYEVLSDAKKRARYDSGQDFDDGDGLRSEVDPSTVFRAFFGEQYSFGNGRHFTFQFS